MVSRRVSRVLKSETVSLSNKVQEMKSRGLKIYNFGIGEPDFTTPDNIIDYAHEKAKEGFTHYTPSLGFSELRNKIAAEYSRRYTATSAKNVLVTPTKFSINLSIMAICDDDDEILIPEPYYLSYPDICRLNGVKPVSFPSREDFSIDFEYLEGLINPRTRAILISNPSNPTGKVLSESDIKHILSLCKKYNIYFICDQIYEDLIYHGKLFSPLNLDPALKNTIILSGFSKSFAMTGWRIGFMIASDDIIEAADTFQQQTITCAPSISQQAAIFALDHYEESTRMRNEFEKRREIAIREMKKIPNISLKEPEGAFYLFPKYDLPLKSRELCMQLLEKKGVSTIPGSVFGDQGEMHFRLSYAASEDDIINGIAKIGEFFREYK
jgi:aspartate aminotransferase